MKKIYSALLSFLVLSHAFASENKSHHTIQSFLSQRANQNQQKNMLDGQTQYFTKRIQEQGNSAHRGFLARLDQESTSNSSSNSSLSSINTSLTCPNNTANYSCPIDSICGNKTVTQNGTLCQWGYLCDPQCQNREQELSQQATTFFAIIGAVAACACLCSCMSQCCKK